jgi:hypothetical protein
MGIDNLDAIISMGGKFMVGIHPLIKSLIMLVLLLILIITKWSPVVNIISC